MSKKPVQVGKQGLLLDIHGEGNKELLDMAHEYRETVLERVDATAREVVLKNRIRDKVQEMNLQPIEGNKITIKIEDTQISVTPRDELVQVKIIEKAAGSD